MKAILLAVGLTLILVGPASAHHNWAAIYDVQGDIEIEGVISSIEFVNPHIRIGFTVGAGTPNEKIYTTESNSVASLTRMGVTEELLAVGTPVRVAGYPSRTRDDDIFMNHLLLPSGQEIVFLRTAEARWPGESSRIGSAAALHGGVVEESFSKRPTSVFAVWSTIYGAEGSHQALGAEVNWTEYGENYHEQARQNEAPVDISSCSPRGLLAALGAPYPIQLIDNKDGTLTIHAEFYDSIRTVHMGDMPENPVVPHEFNGHYSAGRFVGDTLVVDSLFYREGGIEGDDYEQILETFTLSADHNQLQYSRTTIDPLFRSLPTMQKKWWQYVPGSFVQPYNCNY
jgi:hypothetical protein